MKDQTAPVLIAGSWRAADATGTFKAYNPTSMEPLDPAYPVSSWRDIESAIEAAAEASEQMKTMPAHQIAQFLERYAERLEARQDEIVQMAHKETALPVAPRLADVELPRTTNQLRQAAAAARHMSWTMATIDTKTNIRSCYAPLEGGVFVFGPNNFPLAFNGISGGDFAAALAAGNPVIAKANTSHPGVTRMMAEEAFAASQDTAMPAATVQLLYRTSHEDGERMVAHRLTGATGYTGSRSAGLALKRAADAAGKPIYLELSSVNPVLIFPGALEERGDTIAEEFQTSCLLGVGQFCTNPGLVVLLAGESSERFLRTVVKRFEDAPVGTLLSKGVEQGMEQSVQVLQEAGAEILTGGAPGGGTGYSYENTVLKVSGSRFLEDPEALQTEAFGNESLFVIAESEQQLKEIVRRFEGNLTGSIYSDTGGEDDRLYDEVAGALRQRVGRLLNDKMPTGVAVVPSMNHGGPYPATGHPGMTAVGIPPSMIRFAALHCYDNVREHRLPPVLRDKNPTGKTWRRVDDRWTQADVS